jgi:aerobic carbon-monoxide dehydrogenase small subunit
MTGSRSRRVTLVVNGVTLSAEVEARRSLLDCLREDLHLHGTHVGCEHGVCGCCNVSMNGDVVRSCLVLAVQADGANITTVEGLESASGLSPLQESFCEYHALQCGYCTPGILISLTDLLDKETAPGDAEIIEALSGNLCRCTGYQQILEATRAVVARSQGREPTPPEMA